VNGVAKQSAQRPSSTFRWSWRAAGVLLLGLALGLRQAFDPDQPGGARRRCSKRSAEAGEGVDRDFRERQQRRMGETV
jgi:hypothetical protein